MESTVPEQRRSQGEFCWTDLSATDLDAQTRFYEGLFGWTHDDVRAGTTEDYRMFRKDGAIVAGAGQLNPQLAEQGVPSMWNTYVAVEDADRTVARAEQLGGGTVLPPVDVMDQGRIAAIADPTGATLFLWQAKNRIGAERFGEDGSLLWNELNTREPSEASRFLAALFDWRVQRADSSMAYWTIETAGQTEGGIMAMPDEIPEGVPAHWLVYFGADDVRAAVERARELGGHIDLEAMEAGPTVFAVITDPQGATFALMQPLAEDAAE